MAVRATWFAGVACILFVAVLWTLATVLKQVIFQDLGFDEPLILTYVCNACYVVHLPIRGALRGIAKLRGKPWQEEADSASASEGSPVRTAIMVGTVISPVWFAAQWTYSQGVASTSVTSSTVISTTSVVWTLLGSVVFDREELTSLKVVGILACMGGNVATLWGSDRQDGQQGHFWGDVLCLAAAMLYATYTLILKRLTRSSTPFTLLFGVLGLVIFVAGAPFVLVLDMQGLRRLTPKIFGLLIFNGIFDNVMSQFVWAKAVQWTSPTTATVGLSLTIPLSVVADYLRGRELTGWSFVAAALVLLGFTAVTLASKPPTEAAAAACATGRSAEAGEASCRAAAAAESARTPLRSASHGPGEGPLAPRLTCSAEVMA